MRVQFDSSGKQIQVDSPAKLNLVLEVLGKRSDGYHEIASIVCPIDLWDHLEIEESDDDRIHLHLELPQDTQSDDSAWQIPSGPTNLVARAAELVRKTLGLATGCRIRLKKRIPAGAGLGGGSGNAAATIVGCLLLWSDWDRNLAGELCSKLGSDLNFFLGSESGFGLTLMEGRGERTHLLDYRPMLPFWLLNPPIGCSTAEIYSRVEEIGCCGKISKFLHACQSRQDSKIGAALFNALQLPASKVNPWVEIQLRLLAESGCGSSLMTGSGASCFALAGPSDHFGELQVRAKGLGIARAYQVRPWYGEALERQILRK